MESFDSYVGGGDEDMAHTRPFDSDGYMGFDPRLPSQRFESFRMPEEDYTPEEYKNLEGLDEEDEFGARKEGTSSNGAFDDTPPPYHAPFDDEVSGEQSPSLSSTFGQSFESRLQPEYIPADDFSAPVNSNGMGFGHGGEGFPHSEGLGHGEVDSLYGYPPSEGSPLNNNGSVFNNGGAVLPPPEEMQSEEGFVLREWKRKNALHLEEKARIEREQLARIIDAADAFKEEFYAKRKTNCETNKNNNREKEKLFLENLQNFHATADKQYWKAVAELIPHELPALEQRSRGNKDKDKKRPTVVINHGPKPGKATDLSRMRQVLVKLKHNPPAHMKAPPPPPAAPPAAAAPRGEDAVDANASGGGAPPVPPPAPAAPLETQGSIPLPVAVA